MHAAYKPTTAIVVDKKTNKLFLTEYRDGQYTTIKQYHATVGRVKGDKEDEGDLKTPEGIYILHSRTAPPQLKAKFGVMAFNLNYPNAFDQIAGRTGFGIMLHATNEPERLKQNYDSEGCVVVENQEIREIEKQIRLGLTPMLIFAELPPDFMASGKIPELKGFFEGWINAWETENINSYIDHYHSDFSAQGMNRKHWKEYKASLNKRYSTIKIGPEDVRYYKHPKYSVVTFTQNYRSTMKNGWAGHKSRGTKILYVAEESGKPKIIAETYTTLMW